MCKNFFGVRDDAKIRYVEDRAGHDRRYAIDASKINANLAWAPQVDFDTGIRKTVAWYLDNPAWIEAIQDGSYQNDFNCEKG